MPILSFTGTGKGKECSSCNKYKYVEYIRWDPQKPSVMFILLNPSNDAREKAIIRKCVAYADFWGFGQVYITYLFAYKTPYVQELSRALHIGLDMVGPDNNLENIGKQVDMVIFAWGPYGGLGGRDKKIINLFTEDAHYIELSILGYPKDPLTLKSKILPQRYAEEAIC
jgi:hypothetical protein